MNTVRPTPRPAPAKFLPGVLALLLCLGGCANNALVAKQARIRDATIAGLERIEIFYLPQDKLPIVDHGGTALSSLSSVVLGPVGMLVVMGASAGSKLTATQRAAVRSKAFSQAVAGSLPGTDLNRDFAEALAKRIRASGREARVTAAEPFKGDLQTMRLQRLAASAGFTPLLLNITAGYTAPDALSSYQPVVRVQQALQNPGTTAGFITEHNATDEALAPALLYTQYDSLMADHVRAYESLRSILNRSLDPVFRSLFADTPPANTGRRHPAQGRIPDAGGRKTRRPARSRAQPGGSRVACALGSFEKTIPARHVMWI